MSTKIDQSLDEIMANTGSARNARAQRNRRRPGRKPSAQAAPAGGVAKTTRAAKTIVKRVTPTGPAAQRTSKVIASNLVCLPPIWPLYLGTKLTSTATRYR